MKIFVSVYAIISAIIAITTSIMQIQPALFFIEPLTGSDNKFSLTLTMLLTFLTFFLPLVIFLLIKNRSNKQKNEMPDLNGKTGIIVHRIKALSGALLDSGIMINGELKSSVSNGKSTFIELPWGKYSVSLKGNKKINTDIEIPKREIINMELSIIDDGGLKAKITLIQVDN